MKGPFVLLRTAKVGVRLRPQLGLERNPPPLGNPLGPGWSGNRLKPMLIKYISDY